MVPVPVPEKIGPGKSTGPGTGKNSGYRHTLGDIEPSFQQHQAYLCRQQQLSAGYDD